MLSKVENAVVTRALTLVVAMAALWPAAGFAAGTPDEICEIASAGTLECLPGELCSWTGSEALGCTDMSADDLIRIVEGGVVTVGSGGIHAEPSSCSQCGIEVKSGGVFDQAVPEGSANDVPAYVSRLGASGLDCNAGSACTLAGKVLAGFGTSSVTLAGALPALGPVVGDMIPCPDPTTGDPQCSGSEAEGIDDTFRIAWSESEYGPWDGEGATNLDDFISAIEAGSDYMCAFRFGGYGPAPRYLPGWLNQCYRITAVSDPDADPLWLDIDVLQGEADAPIQPLSRRMIFQGTLQSDVAPGSEGRTFYLSDSTLASSPSPGTDWDRMWMDGAWLYFEQNQIDTDGCAAGDGCRLEPRPYRLMEARPDDTCAPGNESAGERCSVDADCDEDVDGDGLGVCVAGDLVILVDEEGATTSHLSGTTVWVGLGLGFSTGDRFAVVRPSRVASSVTDKSDAPTPMHFGGALNLQFAHLEYPGDLSVTACPDTWEHIWITDSMGGKTTGGNNDALLDGALTTDCDTWGQTTFTGTDPRSDMSMSNTEHGISFEAGSSASHRQAQTFHDWALRYHNDDCVDIHNPESQFITEMRFTGLFSCEYVGQGDTAALFDGHEGSWCDEDNLNAEIHCGTDADCDLVSPDDQLGRCVAAPRIFDVEAASCINCAIDDRTSADDIGSALCEGSFFGGDQRGLLSIGGMVSPGASCNFVDLSFLGGETDENNGTWLRRATGLVVREAASHEGSNILNLEGVANNAGHLVDAFFHSTPDLEAVDVTGDGVRIDNVTFVNEQGPAMISIANRYSDWSVENVTIVGGEGWGKHRFRGAESTLGQNIAIGSILLVNQSTHSAVQRMTDEGGGFDQPNISYSGSWCFENISDGFFNSTDEQDLLDAGMPVAYLDNAGFEEGTWSPAEGGVAAIAECGALPGLDAPGIHFTNDALLVSKLEPECAATNCKIERGEVNCGDSELDLLEQCDDGNRDSGDGCSERCTLENALTLEPLAADGAVRIWVDSIPVGVELAAGQTAADAAHALAEAINDNPRLQERGRVAFASGDHLITDAHIDVITVDGLGAIEALLGLTLLGILRRRRHKRFI